MAGSNWQQLSGGSTNPWTIRRDDGTPTANYGDHIICDGGIVTLPSPQANEAVLVSNISSTTEIVPNGTETIEGGNSVRFDQTDPIAFVSDGANWYVSNNLDYIGATPDSVVALYDARDDNSITTDGSGNVTEWKDKAGSFDLSSSDTIQVQEIGINGNQSLSFNPSNSDNLINNSFSQSQPYTAIMVLDLGDTTAQRPIYGSLNNRNETYWISGDSNWSFFAGGTGVLDASTDDTIQQITAVVDGSSTAIREEGTQTASGSDVGTNGFDGIEVGSRNNESDFFDGQIGYLEIHDKVLSGSELTDRENTILNEWGI